MIAQQWRPHRSITVHQVLSQICCWETLLKINPSHCQYGEPHSSLASLLPRHRLYSEWLAKPHYIWAGFVSTTLHR